MKIKLEGSQGAALRNNGAGRQSVKARRNGVIAPRRRPGSSGIQQRGRRRGMGLSCEPGGWFPEVENAGRGGTAMPDIFFQPGSADAGMEIGHRVADRELHKIIQRRPRRTKAGRAAARDKRAGAGDADTKNKAQESQAIQSIYFHSHPPTD